MNDYRSRDRRDRRRSEKHKAVCDECGKECYVPFKPTGDKPIYCNECFDKRGGGSSRNRSPRSKGGFGDKSPTELLNEVKLLNTKLDKIIDLLTSKEKSKKKSKKVKKEKSK